MNATEATTPPSLLEKVRSLTDDPAWRRFDRLYRGLVAGFAIRCGLAPADAEDVAAETMATLVRRMPGYRYEPQRCRFRSFVFGLAKAQVVDFWRRRDAAQRALAELAHRSRLEPSEEAMAAEWQAEWEHFVMLRALDRLGEHRRLELRMKTVLIELYVRGRPDADAARLLGRKEQDIYRIRSRWKQPLTQAVAQVRRELEGE